jgi:hypothetical protein
MSAEITTTGILINQTPVKGVLNPWETHTFSHQIELVEDPEIETHLEWRITGDLPAGHKLGVDDKLYAKDQIQEYLEALNINLTDEILEQILEE